MENEIEQCSQVQGGRKFKSFNFQYVKNQSKWPQYYLSTRKKPAMTANKYNDYGMFLKRIHDLHGENSKQQAQNQENEPNQSQIEKKARNEISVQYYSFFQEVGTLLQSFRLEELPEQVYSTHRIKLISDESSWQFKKLLGETLSYVQLVSSSHNGLQCYYNVLIGRFFLTVKVLNLHINSEIETYDNQFLGQGSYGKVKRLSVQKKQIAIKKIVFPKKKILNVNANHLLNNQDFADFMEIRKAISQYCLYKICSMLKIGPQVIFENTYDLVCYNNCIEFQMELCEEIGKKINLDAYERDLKRCLGILHSVKIIHKDIKKSNTLYSPAFSSYILSDFGLTHPVNQPFWRKTQTYFGGSPSHACEQMKKLLYKGESGYVNLYLNDIHGLKVTLEQMRSQQKIYEQQYSRNSMSVGKHVYDCEEDQSYNEYVSSKQDCSRSSSSEDYYGPVVTGLMKNQQSEQNKISRDTINYYFIKALFEFLRGLQERSKQNHLMVIKKIISQMIKNEPNFEKMRYQIEKMAALIINCNLCNEKLQLTNIRNSIRMFGLNSVEVSQLLSEICAKRTISALNYSKIESYLVVSNKKNKVVIKKFQNQLINMDRHYLLHNTKSLTSSLKNLIRTYLSAKEHKDEEKYEIFLFGIQVLSYEELTERENSELIVMLWQIFFGEQISADNVDASICLEMVDKLFLSISVSSEIHLLMMLNALIKIHLKYKSTEAARNYFNKIRQSKQALIKELTCGSELTEEQKKQIKCAIIRHGSAEVVYYTQIKQYQQSLQLCKINYIKFTEYQLMDDGVKIKIMEDMVRNLVELGQYEQADGRNQELGILVQKHCFPRKNCAEFAFYYSYRGMCQYSRNEIEKALKSFELSIQCGNDSLRGPHHIRLIKQNLQNLSSCYKILKQDEKSIGYLEKALQVSLMYSQFNDYDQAIRYIQDIILRLLQSNQFNQRVYAYTEQLANYKNRFLNSSKITVQFSTRVNAELFPVEFSKNLNEEAKVFLYKQLISSAQPYLPTFLNTYKELCEHVTKRMILKRQFAEVVPYFSKIFKYSSRVTLSPNARTRINMFLHVLFDIKQCFLATRFLKRIVLDIPIQFQDFKFQVYEWFQKLSITLKKCDAFFYGYVWKYRAFINMENLIQAQNNLNYLKYSKGLKLLFKKKLAKLKNSLTEITQEENSEHTNLNPQNITFELVKQESAESIIKQKLKAKFKRMKNKQEKISEEQIRQK